jgi:hypothetical protein
VIAQASQRKNDHRAAQRSEEHQNRIILYPGKKVFVIVGDRNQERMMYQIDAVAVSASEAKKLSEPR